MILLNRGKMLDYDPEDKKPYYYDIRFIEPTGVDSYIFKFNRYDSITGARVGSLRFDGYNSDVETLCSDPAKYWNYYNHLFNHDKPVTVYCRFNRDGELYSSINKSEIPQPTDIFNEVISVNNTPTPIYVINMWMPRHGSLETDLSENIREIIRRYRDSEGSNEE